MRSPSGVEFTAPEVGAFEPEHARRSRARIVGEAGGQEKGILAGRSDRRDQRLAGARLGRHPDHGRALGGRCIVDVARPTPSGVPVKLTLEATPEKEDDEPIPRLGIGAQRVVRGFDDDSPARDKGILDRDEIVDSSLVGSATATAPVVSGGLLRAPEDALVDLAAANPGQPIRIRIRRRTFDADGSPLPQPPKLVDVEVTPLASRPIYGIGVELGPEARVTRVTNDSPAKGVLEPGDTILTLDGRDVTYQNHRDTIKAVGDARQGAPVPVVFERVVAGKRDKREAKVTLQKHPDQDGWFLGVVCSQQRVASVGEGQPGRQGGDRARRHAHDLLDRQDARPVLQGGRARSSRPISSARSRPTSRISRGRSAGKSPTGASRRP